MHNCQIFKEDLAHWKYFCDWLSNSHFCFQPVFAVASRLYDMIWYGMICSSSKNVHVMRNSSVAGHFNVGCVPLKLMLYLWVGYVSLMVIWNIKCLSLTLGLPAQTSFLMNADISGTTVNSQTFFACKWLNDILKLYDLNIVVENVTIFVLNTYSAKKKFKKVYFHQAVKHKCISTTDVWS